MLCTLLLLVKNKFNNNAYVITPSKQDQKILYMWNLNVIVVF